MILTFITILIYTLVRSFIVDEAFKYNALVIFVPIIIILFIKMLIVTLGFKGSVRHELYSIFISTLMFIPFILIEISGEVDSLKSYLALLIPLGLLGLAIYKRRLNVESSLVGLSSILVVASFISMNYMNNSADIALYIILELLVLSLALVCLIKNNIDYKNHLVNLLVAVAIIGLARGIGNIYSGYRLASMAVIILALLKLVWVYTKKINILSNVGEYLAIVFTLDNLIGLIISLANKEGLGFINTDFLFNATALLSLVLFESYLNKNNVEVKSKLPVLGCSLIVAIMVVASLNANLKSDRLHYLEKSNVVNTIDYNRLKELGYNEMEIAYIDSNEYDLTKDLNVIKGVKTSNEMNGIKTNLYGTHYSKGKEKGLLIKASFYLNSDARRNRDLIHIAFTDDLMLMHDNNELRIAAKLFYKENDVLKAVELNSFKEVEDGLLIDLKLPSDNSCYKNAFDKVENNDFIVTFSFWLVLEKAGVTAASASISYYNNLRPSAFSYKDIRVEDKKPTYKNNIFMNSPKYVESNALLLFEGLE